MCDLRLLVFVFFFFFNDTATTEIYTLSLHDALPIWSGAVSTSVPSRSKTTMGGFMPSDYAKRSEEHTSELQSLRHLVCRLLLEKKKASTKVRTTRSGGSSCTTT